MSDQEDNDEGDGKKYNILYQGETAPQKAVTKDGVATATFANGDVYTGMYKDQKRNGRGVYKYGKGMLFDGEYVNNKKEGQGQMTYIDGGKYTGEWKANARHGFGTYIYPNGDSYSGEWKDNKKSGQGKYVFADNGSSMSGTWVANRCVSGVWSMADKSRYVGRFANNVPAGNGLFVFANKNKEAGTFVDGNWLSDSFAPPAPSVVPPVPTKAGPLVWAKRAIEKCTVVVDHFEGISQIPERAKGVPNLRQATKLPVWGGGQPTLTGVKEMMTALDEEGSQKLMWISLRDTPVCYVNNVSFTGARKEGISRPMTFPDLKNSELPLLDSYLAEKLVKEIRATGGIMSYWKLALADREEDVKRVEIVMEVEEKKSEEEEEGDNKKPGVLPVRTVAELFKPEGWSEQNEVDVQYSRMSIGDHTFPEHAVVDGLLTVAREVSPGVALFFQDQGGFSRATCAMILASLVRFLFEEPEEVNEEEKNEPPPDEEPEDEPDPDDDDLDDEEKEARKQARAAAKAARKAAKAEEDHDEEILPNYTLGEYAIIKELVKALGATGEKFKNDTDAIINRNAQLSNLREVILAQKESGNKARAQDYLERYFYFILFYTYLKTNQESEFEKPFSEWVKDGKGSEYVGILGTREEGALADFNWT